MDIPTADELPEDFSLYFEPSAGTVILPLTLLVASKPPETQPGSVSKAAALMRAAADGTVPRRRPITVRPLPGGKYLIVDGNATYGAALRAGWSSIPATVET
ncbi:MAG TPA: ParB/Srx family N-terminal domain-containing protein [Solirubrobacteraceae bacterium]|jgi:hypothetical protein